MKLKEFKKPKIHTVVKRNGRKFWEYFCTTCQRIVDDPNKRCKGSSKR